MTIEKYNRANLLLNSIKNVEKEIELISKYDCGGIGWEISYDNFRRVNGISKELKDSIKQQLIDELNETIKKYKREFEEL